MVLGCIHACMRPLFPQKTKQNKETNIRWFITPLSSICKKNFTYSYEKEWSGWVKQHALNETFGFLERTLVRNKKENKVEKMQTPLEKKACIKNTWLRRFVIWWINTDLLPPMRKNIHEWGFDLLLSIKKTGIRKNIYMNVHTGHGWPKACEQRTFSHHSENGALIIIDLKFNTVFIDGHWTRLQNKDVLPSGVTEAK